MKQSTFVYKQFKQFLETFVITYRNVSINSIYYGVVLGLLALLSKDLGYSSFDEEAIADLNKRYYSKPSLEVALALQLLNIVDLLERAEKYLNIEGDVNE